MLSRQKDRINFILIPFARLAGKAGLTPNHLTFIGFLTGLISASIISTGNYFIGSILMLLSGGFDALDGALARNYSMKTEFGGILDSVMDRYVDIALFIGIGLSGINWLYVILALSGALMVSYVRARSENAIKKCAVGFAERAERMIILFFGLITGYIEISLILIAVLAHATAIYRILYSRRVLIKNSTD